MDGPLPVNLECIWIKKVAVIYHSSLVAYFSLLDRERQWLVGLPDSFMKYGVQKKLRRRSQQ